MIPLDQTTLAPEKWDGVTFGNCVQACVASILEVPLNKVPHYCHLNQLAKSQQMFDLGYTMIKTDIMTKWPGFHLMAGFGPREQIGVSGASFPIGHAVVGFNGEMVFDPHPSRAGLRVIEEFWWFVRLKPGFAPTHHDISAIVEVSNRLVKELERSVIAPLSSMRSKYTI